MSKRLAVAVAMAISTVALVAGPAAAHNAGNVTTGNGTCVTVGSEKPSPVVGDGNPNQLPDGSLDLVPGPFDQYGARYAADKSPAIAPRPCP